MAARKFIFEWFANVVTNIYFRAEITNFFMKGAKALSTFYIQ